MLVRRSGKLTVLKLYKEYLESHRDGQILFINFEHPDTFNLQSHDALYEYIKEVVNKDKKVYFIFDAIQEVSEWQRLINGLTIAFDCDIYISGSNASLLSGELATLLMGRYVEIKVLLFRFRKS